MTFKLNILDNHYRIVASLDGIGGILRDLMSGFLTTEDSGNGVPVDVNAERCVTGLGPETIEFETDEDLLVGIEHRLYRHALLASDETDDDVEDLAGFLREARLDWAGFFPYSAEEGTPAATMEDQVPEAIKAERTRYLQSLQDDITTGQTIGQVGRTLEVVVDQIEDGQAVARSYREAPEIDGVVLLDRGEPGDWLTATVTGGYGTDLTATVVG